MTQRWIPSDNPDHIVEWNDDEDAEWFKKGRVIKGNKTLQTLINENLDSNTDLKTVDRARLKQKYRS